MMKVCVIEYNCKLIDTLIFVVSAKSTSSCKQRRGSRAGKRRKRDNPFLQRTIIVGWLVGILDSSIKQSMFVELTPLLLTSVSRHVVFQQHIGESSRISMSDVETDSLPACLTGPARQGEQMKRRWNFKQAYRHIYCNQNYRRRSTPALKLDYPNSSCLPSFCSV